MNSTVTVSINRSAKLRTILLFSILLLTDENNNSDDTLNVTENSVFSVCTNQASPSQFVSGREINTLCEVNQLEIVGTRNGRGIIRSWQTCPRVRVYIDIRFI